MCESVVIKQINKESFELGMQIISLNELPFSGVFKSNGYKVINGELFLSRYSESCVKFAYEFNLQQTIDFAWGWLLANPPSMESKYMGDGSSIKGFELSTERSDIGSDDWGMFCSVKPIWIYHGK